MEQQYTKADRLTALLLAILILLAGFFSLDYGCRFGDDYAAYINVAISIAEGDFEKQTHLNYIMHPTGTTVDGSSARVYVWGYPLLLSSIYKLVGFNRETFDSIIWYKIPSVIALAIFTACFFMFLRRRFGYKLSLVAAVAVSCAGCEFFIFINNLYSDIVFLSFEMLVFLIAEIRNAKSKKSIFLSSMLGILLWYTYEIRSTGLFVAFTILFLQMRQSVRERRKKPADIVIDYCPFLIAALFVFLSEHFVFAHATSEISAMGRDLTVSLNNVKRYGSLLLSWISSLTVIRSPLPDQIGLILTALLLTVISVFSIMNRAFKSDPLYFLFAFFYFAGTCLMSYYQGMRYLYPVLPFAVLFILYGLQKILSSFCLKYKKLKEQNVLRRIPVVLALFLIIISAVPVIQMDLRNMKNGRIRDNAEAYSEEAKDIYRYIISNTEKDSIISFYTARSLFLNTERVTVPNEILIHTREVDYFLESAELDYHLQEKYRTYFSEIYRNNGYVLLKNNNCMEKYNDF